MPALRGGEAQGNPGEPKPFDRTDEDRAYLLGLRHGDLSVWKPWKDVVRVSTSTTHPAMAELFRTLFEPYGHAYQSPRYKDDTKTYEWNLYTLVDGSFDFHLDCRAEVWKRVAQNESTWLAYLAGVLDAEGSVGIHSNGTRASVRVTYHNTSQELLFFIKAPPRNSVMVQLGHISTSAREHQHHRVERRKDYNKLALQRFDDAKDLVRRLPIKHNEKVRRKQLALAIPNGQAWSAVGPQIDALRSKFRDERDAFVHEAEMVYPQGHPLPTA